MTGGSSIENFLWSTGIPPNFRSVYGWMSDFALAKQKNQVNFVKIESKRTTNYFTWIVHEFWSGCVPADTTSTSSNLTSGISTSNPETTQPLDSFCEVANLDLKTAIMTCSENDVHGQYIEETDCKIFTSRCDTDSQDTNIALSTNDLENSIEDSRNGLHEHHDQRKTFVQADPSEVEISLSGKEKPVYTLASKSMPLQEQWPGIFVSLCLHPMDTEYHSLAHCTAGGCASIATSFIFTPSERIKQQMQVGSHYRNCWNALIQVFKKAASLHCMLDGELSSAEMFLILSSSPLIMFPFVQLVCGGLAGCMASLFTTPFDVVKTRLQTQIPGSTTTYNGVFNTLKEIGKQEGLKGLYRSAIAICPEKF
ncbi:UNVERIFIED_CONTAM: protein MITOFERRINLIKE 1, chloroplastic [Sesamum radiatum]|uniref:Protein MITOFERRINLIKE 1, chloroplastic n=1 Tax=Sesamum radiatum TaxID=300843 RepID=A0AAW2L2V3_SESRA